MSDSIDGHVQHPDNDAYNWNLQCSDL